MSTASDRLARRAGAWAAEGGRPIWWAGRPDAESAHHSAEAGHSPTGGGDSAVSRRHLIKVSNCTYLRSTIPVNPALLRPAVHDPTRPAYRPANQEGTQTEGERQSLRPRGGARGGGGPEREGGGNDDQEMKEVDIVVRAGETMLKFRITTAEIGPPSAQDHAQQTPPTRRPPRDQPPQPNRTA